jgi:ABC-type multidrug transport system fused ATPase/permease subunit
MSDTYFQYIQNQYYKKFIKTDNNSYEKYGTGKLAAIIDKGMDIWSYSIEVFFNKSLDLVIAFIFVSYMLAKNNMYFLFTFILLYVLFYFWAHFINKGAIKYRKQRNDVRNEHTKDSVKIIMNKQEILQTKKINTEIKRLYNYKQKEIEINKNVSNFLTPLFE